MFAIRLTTVAVAAVAFAAVVVGAAVLGTVTSEAQTLPVAQTGAEKIVLSCKAAAEFQNEICLMNPDGTGKQRLTDSPDDDGRPVFSPDGGRIAWTVGNAIWVMNVDGTDQHRIHRVTLQRFLVGSPTWAPDGQRLAFICSPSAICVMPSSQNLGRPVSGPPEGKQLQGIGV